VSAALLRIKLLHPGAVPPRQQTGGSAGLDLCAALESSLTLGPGERAVIPTGVAVSISAGFEGQVRPRSGLAARHGVTVLNTPGTIDSDYRGEVRVVLINFGREPFTVGHGDRIAQLGVAPVATVRAEGGEELDATERGDGGFGHTGLRGDE